uniref:Tumor necrosis factor receptor superfamily, member 1a n=1 Tax=Labrus bergylta TaxID=56723 RepID=A0A3Q3EN13_9LABR
FSVTLILQCMFIPTLTALLQLSEELKCQDDEYLNEEIGVCCNKCHPGFKLVKMCPNKDQRSNCTACPKSQFNEERNYTPNCRTCKICRSRESPCDTKHNTVCRCEDGYYKSIIDSENSECIRCSRCGQNKREKQKCEYTEKNTECECTENYQSVKNRCEPFPDLIYMVLDLVPVLKVKQLMRALGVRDSEIEHAELDYRSSREAHYQMLRVWAERGSRAGGGGCGGMLTIIQALFTAVKGKRTHLVSVRLSQNNFYNIRHSL